MNQMDLTQIGLGRVPANAGKMLDGLSAVRVAFHAQPGDEANVRLIGFAKGVRAALAHGSHGAHWEIGVS